jgi:hypothetical protein
MDYWLAVKINFNYLKLNLLFNKSSEENDKKRRGFPWKHNFINMLSAL